MLSQSMIVAYHATSLWAWNRPSVPNNWQTDFFLQSEKSGFNQIQNNKIASTHSLSSLYSGGHYKISGHVHILMYFHLCVYEIIDVLCLNITLLQNYFY